MAKYYKYDSNDLLNIKVALDDYYSSGLTYYGTPSSTSIIFSHVNISDKIVNLFKTADGVICVQLGSWNGSVFTRTVNEFAGTYTHSAYAIDSISIIAKEDCLALFCSDVSTNRTDKFIFIGKMSDGKFIAFAITEGNNAINNIAYDVLLTDNTSLMLRGLVDIMQSPTGNLFKAPIYIEDVASGTILMSGGNPVTINGVYFASKKTGWAEVKGTGYYLSPSGGYTRSTAGFVQILNSLLFTDITN